MIRRSGLNGFCMGESHSRDCIFWRSFRQAKRSLAVRRGEQEVAARRAEPKGRVDINERDTLLQESVLMAEKHPVHRTAPGGLSDASLTGEKRGLSKYWLQNVQFFTKEAGRRFVNIVGGGMGRKGIAVLPGRIVKREGGKGFGCMSGNRPVELQIVSPVRFPQRQTPPGYSIDHNLEKAERRIG